MSASEELCCGINLAVEEAIKNAKIAEKKDLRGAYPMASRVLAVEVERLRRIIETSKTTEAE